MAKRCWRSARHHQRHKSAHLDGADFELAIPSWHSVQETPAAILELRRILALHAAALRAAMP